MQNFTVEQVEKMSAESKHKSLLDMLKGYNDEIAAVDADITDCLLLGGSESGDLQDLLAKHNRLVNEHTFIKYVTGEDKREREAELERRLKENTDKFNLICKDVYQAGTVPPEGKFDPLTYIDEADGREFPKQQVHTDSQFSLHEVECFSVFTPDGGLVVIRPRPEQPDKLQVAYYAPLAEPGPTKRG